MICLTCKIFEFSYFEFSDIQVIYNVLAITSFAQAGLEWWSCRGWSGENPYKPARGNRRWFPSPRQWVNILAVIYLAQAGWGWWSCRGWSGENP